MWGAISPISLATLGTHVPPRSNPVLGSVPEINQAKCCQSGGRLYGASAHKWSAWGSTCWLGSFSDCSAVQYQSCHKSGSGPQSKSCNVVTKVQRRPSENYRFMRLSWRQVQRSCRGPRPKSEGTSFGCPQGKGRASQTQPFPLISSFPLM